MAPARAFEDPQVAAADQPNVIYGCAVPMCLAANELAIGEAGGRRNQGLTDATNLLAHNPKVGGSNPPVL